MELFIMIAVTHFIALLSPGPDFFLLLTTLLRSGIGAARWVCLGIVTGNLMILIMIYICLASFGQIHPVLLTIIQSLGIVYLSYLSWSCYRAARVKQEQMELLSQVPSGTTTTKGPHAYMLGLQSSVFNPKNLMFYSSIIIMIFLEFSGWQHGLVGLWMLSVVLCWNLLLLQLFKQASWIRRLNMHAQKIYAVAAFCFMSFAAMGAWVLMHSSQ